ncbi:MFS transporter [Pullulanibacillus camelliae]|uniref:MFS transporter n=1 Tax=Pullulanibacillus camelliae TaxID=1707096 RepID=A0A8J2VHR2_9BACL|nr:MFS transporter [Pullulanibacillus camelliae]GGE30267.1 MFS transporter [Pullulanibacillus camelliae]
MLLAKDSVLRYRSFPNFLGAQIFSSTSFQMLSVAIGWQMYALTHDAFSLGFVGLAQFLPMVLLTLVAGHVADRFDRRKIVFLCQMIEGCTAALLLVSNLAGWIDKTHILIAAAIIGACRAFEGPSFSALLPQVMPKAILQQAISWVTSAGQMAQILGPTLGGVLFSIGPNFVYAVATAALISAGVLTFLIHVERRVQNTEPVSLRSVFSGLVFVYQNPIILGTISLDLFAVLLGGATALLPIFAQDILKVGPWALGIMRTAPAVGALLMSFLLASFPIKKAYGPTLFGALGIFGLATMLFAISKNLYVSLFALLLIGASDVISVVIRSSLVQLQTPDEMRGRVNAVNSLFIGTSNQLGEFESGMVAGFIGAVPAAFIGGLGTLAVAGLWMYLFPSLRRLKSLVKE